MIRLFLSIIILLFIMRKPRCALREAYMQIYWKKGGYEESKRLQY